MTSLPIIFLALGALGLIGALAWGFFRSPSRRTTPPRRRKAARASQVSTAPAGSSELTKLAWIVGKMTGVPPRKVSLDEPLATLLAKVDHAEFMVAVNAACRSNAKLDDAGRSMTLKQFAQFLRHLRRAEQAPKGRKRSPKIVGDLMANWEPPLLALAAELGLRPEWELEKARAHLTKEYLRQNARIHLATREADRTAVQNRLECIGRLREALSLQRV